MAFTVIQRELETSILVSLIEQISIRSDTSITDLALEQGNALKDHLKFFSSLNFLSFYNKALGSKTSAKKEIKRNTLFI